MKEVSGSFADTASLYGAIELPTGKHEHGGVAVQGGGQCLGALDTEVDAAGFDTGDCGPRDAAQCRQFALAEPLQPADDANGLAGRNFDALPGGNGFAHVIASGSRAG